MQMASKILFNDGFYVCEGNFVGKENAAYRPVKIPHDFAILQEIGESFAAGPRQGFVDCYHKITYKKHFKYQKKMGEKAYLCFDGVFRNSEVFLNGVPVGGRPYGYVPFQCDLTHAIQDGDNLLEVFVDNSVPPADRWYSGMGIYRDVYFMTTSEVHVAWHGAYITTPEVSKEAAKIHVQYELVKEYPCDVALEVELRFQDAFVARAQCQSAQPMLSVEFTVLNPQLWDLTHPNLYQTDARVMVDGVCMDTHQDSFGIRDIVFEREKGMFLNGQPIKLKGVNLHHDTGCLGAAFLRDAWIRKIQSLKNIGVNAIRCSHNPQAEIFYDLCDEMGILVYDEAFDKWYWEKGYTKEYFDDWWQQDIIAMMKRDRNHPCIFIWSVGNEVELQGTDGMIDLVNRHVAFAKAYEPTRPVTFAMMPHCNPAEDGNDFGVRAYTKGVPHIVGLTQKMNENVPIMSCNYQEQWYQDYHKLMPDKCIIGTETYHYYTDKEGGCNFKNMADKHPFTYVENRDYVIGGFYWAGVDYLGESYRYPARGWSASLLDIAGFERPQAKQARHRTIYGNFDTI